MGYLVAGCVGLTWGGWFHLWGVLYQGCSVDWVVVMLFGVDTG